MTADYTLYGWYDDKHDPRWTPIGSYAQEDAAIEAIPTWMGTYDAYKVDHTVYRFGEL
jgi:hypothetical protein